MNDRTIRTIQVLLTIVAFEFFGPILRDYNDTHAFNPAWVGHARFHLVWLLGFMGLSGIANLWLIWKLPFEQRSLWLSAVWQGCNLCGFWTACILVDSYGGLITVPGEHVLIMGVDENLVVFTILSIVLTIAIGLLAFGGKRALVHATR